MCILILMCTGVHRKYKTRETLRIQIAHRCYRSQFLYILLLWSRTTACQNLRLLQAALCSIIDVPHVVAMQQIRPTPGSTLCFLQQASEHSYIYSLAVDTAPCCRTPIGLPSMPTRWVHIPEPLPLPVHRTLMWTIVRM